MLATYKPSGKFTPIVFILLPVVAAVIIGVAWVYEFLLRLIPFIYIDAFITMGFGALVAFIVGEALKLAKCRNTALSGAIGAGAGVLAFCAGHYFGYLADTGGRMPFADYVRARVDAGWAIGHGASSGGAPFSGIVVWIVWLVEAVILVGLGFGGGLLAAGRPFCERCGFWADRKLRTFSVPGPSAETLAAIASADSVAALLPRPGPGQAGTGDTELVYTVKGCHACDEFAALTVSLKKHEVDTRGNRSSKTSELKTGVLLSREDMELVALTDEQLGATDQVGTSVSQQGS